MGLFPINSLFELIDVLVFLRKEIEVSLKVGVDNQDSFVVMSDSPKPDRRPTLVILMVEVQEPEFKSQPGMTSSTDSVTVSSCLEFVGPLSELGLCSS